MKYLLSLFILCLCVSSIYAQERITEVLKIYKSEAIPFLDQMAKRESNSEVGTPLTLARLNEFKSKIDHLVKDDVVKTCKEKQITNDLKMISMITELAYKHYFTGLPKEFYDSAKADSQKL